MNQRFHSSFSLLCLFACLGGGFVNRGLRAGELSSISTNEVAAAAAPVVVPKTSRSLVESELQMLLTEALQKNYVKDKGELELRFTRPWTAREIPDAPLTVKIVELPTAGVTPSFIVRFDLLAGTESVGTWQIPVQAHIQREVWVARSTTKRGMGIDEADLVRERRDVVNMREALADFTAGDNTIEFAEAVQAGVPLLARTIKMRTVVHRGQIAEARVQDGMLNISMKVEVLEDGAPGQMVRARNPVSRRDVSGRVLADRTILIVL